MCVAVPAIFFVAFARDASAQEIPCSGAPKEAVVVVPESIKDLAAVYCTKYGHYLTGVDGTIWTYPGAMAPALLIAYVEGAKSKQLPPEVGHSKHFTSIKVRNIRASDTAALLAKDDGMPPPPSGAQITAALEISAQNQDGVEQKVYIFDSGQNRWGYLCDPECRPQNTFMVIDMRHRSGA
jgi:hypothetical protein